MLRRFALTRKHSEGFTANDTLMHRLRGEDTNHLVKARVSEAFEDRNFTQQTAGALVVDKNVFKTFARVLTSSRNMDNLHNFAVCSFSELLDELPLFGKTKIFV